MTETPPLVEEPFESTETGISAAEQAATPASQGGKARMRRLTPAERSRLGGNGARARWKKQEPGPSASVPSPETPDPRPQASSPSTRPMPKEFGRALSAAENRLAKAIQERAEAACKWAVLQAEIPYLERTIAALRGQPAPLPQFSPPEFGAVFPWPNPAAGMGFAQPSPAAVPSNYPQASRAQGSAVNVPLPGPEDDEDRFLNASGLPGGEWR
jgi:hypothetical protein